MTHNCHYRFPFGPGETKYLYTMSKAAQPEVWLRGAIPGISPYLQPVVHALLQAKEEINDMMGAFPETLLWDKPAGLASAGFHLRHISGVLDRLLTYARGQQLSAEQFDFLKKEGTRGNETVQELLAFLNQKLTGFIEALKSLDATKLTEAREVGRAKLPSTVLGLLFHAAEHTMRHTRQLLVTVNVLKKGHPAT